MKLKKTGIFYIHTVKGYIPVKGKRIDLWEGLETIIHKNEYGVYWRVSEVTSGCSISGYGTYKTQQQAINNALDKLSAHKNIIKEAIASAYKLYGMAPVSLERRG